MIASTLLKRLLPVALLILSAVTSLAVQDANSNGLSDIWEKFYNGNNLFSGSNPAHAPAADPDGDGVSNANEAIAGTNPFSSALPAGWVRTSIVRHPAAEGLFILSWPSIQGKTYQLAVSSDLSSWADFGDSMAGTGQNISLGVDAIHQDGTIPERLFWRVAIEDEDPDGDTLTTWEELALGYNPRHFDTDLDGILDNLDSAPLSNAVVADPDGRGLPASLETSLLGRWDFESRSFGTGGHPSLIYRYPDSSPFARPARGNVELHLEGMISKATDSTATSVVAIPPAMLNTVAQNQSGLKPRYSVSFWAAMTPGSLTTGAPIGMFGHSTYAPYISNPSRPDLANWAFFRTEADGVWVQRIPGLSGQPDTFELCWGTYIYTNHNNGTGIAPVVVPNYAKQAFAQGKLDDGQWHHYLLTREGTQMSLYRDGVQVGFTSSFARANIGVDSHSAVSLGRLYGPSPDDNPASLGLTRCFTGRFDRLRIWSRTLVGADATALYRQDADQDLLWDITENRSGLWRDANSDATRASSEVSYVSSPFYWQPSAGDTDGDEADDLAEQAAGTNIAKADTDGDLIPDGYELHYPAILNPLNPNDALLDPDGDGLTNLKEWQYNTIPTNPNSDGGNPDYPDTVNDGSEVGGGSDPNDPTDGGQAPAPDQKLTIVLGVGDQSGSHSEDYVLNCYKIDRQTGAEERVYTLRSGGFGQYDEKPVNIFRKGESYSFQIQWQGTNNNTRPASPGVTPEGPDFDYTFKVQPQNDPGGILIDSWNPSNGTLDPSRHLIANGANDVADDAAEFRRDYSSRRVVRYAIQTHSADRMLAGAVTILPGFERMELSITSPDTGRNFGTYGYLLGGGDTRVYESVKGMLGYQDRKGTLVSDPRVWFLKDAFSDKRVEFYLVSGAPGESYGKVKIEAKVQGQSLGSIERTLQPDAAFADAIELVTDWASGRGFGFGTGPGGGTVVAKGGGNLLDGLSLQSPAQWACPTLIPFLVLQNVEGVTIIVRGIGEGVVAGLKDDYEFAKLILIGTAVVADWTVQRLLPEIDKWQNDPHGRMAELHALVTDFFEKQVFEPLADVAMDLSTFEGFKKRFWQAVGTGVAVSATISVNVWNKTVDGLERWTEDFANRMIEGGERTAWLEVPFAKGSLLAEGTALYRTECYAFGYMVGYLSEQVAIGIVTEGTFRIAQVAVKGGLHLAGSLAKRTVASIALRGNCMKRLLAEASELGGELVRPFIENQMRMVPLGPVGPGPVLNRSGGDILENAMSRPSFDRSVFNWREMLDKMLADGNIRKLLEASPNKNLIVDRAAQLAQIMGDQFDAAVLKNFIDVADGRLIIVRPDGMVDDWMEDFIRIFKGSPSDFVNRPLLDEMSPNSVVRIKNFLSEPNPGYAWKYEEGLETNWKAPIVRGMLVELDLWHRIYKPAGWTHVPTSEAIDFLRGVEALQLKSIGTINPNTIARLKDAITDLVNYGVVNNKTTLVLEIKKKTGLDEAALRQQLSEHIEDLRELGQIPQGTSVEVNISDYEFISH